MTDILGMAMNLYKIDVDNLIPELRVLEYNESLKALKLIVTITNLPFVEIDDPFGMLDHFYEIMREVYVELIRTSIEIRLFEDDTFLDLNGVEVVLESDYILDYISPRGLMPVSLIEYWNQSFIYEKIVLVYRGISDSPTEIEKEPSAVPLPITEPEGNYRLYMPNTSDDFLEYPTGSIKLASCEMVFWRYYQYAGYRVPDYTGGSSYFLEFHPLFYALMDDWEVPDYLDPLYPVSLWKWPTSLPPSRYADFVSDLFLNDCNSVLTIEDRQVDYEWGYTGIPGSSLATPGYFSLGWGDWQPVEYPATPSQPPFHNTALAMFALLPVLNLVNFSHWNGKLSLLHRLLYWCYQEFYDFSTTYPPYSWERNENPTNFAFARSLESADRDYLRFYCTGKTLNDKQYPVERKAGQGGVPFFPLFGFDLFSIGDLSPQALLGFIRRRRDDAEE